MNPLPIALAASLALTWVPGSSATQEPTVSQLDGQADDPRSWTFDELIERLPPPDEETSRDPDSRRFVLHPAVAEVKRRLEEGQKPTDAQWRALLVQSEVIRWRDTWAADIPFAISMRKPCWLSLAWIQVRLAKPHRGKAGVGSHTAPWCGNDASGRAQAALYQELVTLPAGSHRLILDVKVQRGLSSMGTRREVDDLWEGQLPIDLRVLSDVDDLIRPVVSDELDRAVEQSMSIRMYTIGKADFIKVALDPNFELYPQDRSLTFSLRADLRHNDEVVHTFDLRPYGAAGRAAATSRDQRLFAQVAEAMEDPRGWSLRVEGTARYAFEVWGATERWNGDVTIPLSEVRLVRKQDLRLSKPNER